MVGRLMQGVGGLVKDFAPKCSLGMHSLGVLLAALN